MRGRILWLVTGLVAGVVGTRLVRVDVSSADLSVTKPKRSPETEKPAINRQQPAAPRASAPPRVQSSEPDNISLLKALRRLKVKNLLSYNVPVFDGENRLMRQARELFQISDPEAASIEQLMGAVGRQITDIEVGTATAVFDPEKQTWTITVPPFPDKGGKIYDEVCRRIGQIVGPERGALFLEMSRMDEKYAEFGVGIRKVTIRKNAGNAGEGVQVEDEEMTDLREIAGQMRYGSSGSSGSSYPDTESMLKGVGPLARKFVPANF